MTKDQHEEVPSCVVISTEFVTSDVSDDECDDDDDSLFGGYDEEESYDSRWEKSISLASPVDGIIPRKPERRRSLRRPRRCLQSGDHQEQEATISRTVRGSQSPRCPKRQASRDGGIATQEPLTVEMSLRLLLGKSVMGTPRRGNNNLKRFTRFQKSKETTQHCAKDVFTFLDHESGHSRRDIHPPSAERVRSINKGIEQQLQAAIDALQSC